MSVLKFGWFRFCSWCCYWCCFLIISSCIITLISVAVCHITFKWSSYRQDKWFFNYHAYPIFVQFNPMISPNLFPDLVSNVGINYSNGIWLIGNPSTSRIANCWIDQDILASMSVFSYGQIAGNAYYGCMLYSVVF